MSQFLPYLFFSPVFYHFYVFGVSYVMLISIFLYALSSDRICWLCLIVPFLTTVGTCTFSVTERAWLPPRFLSILIKSLLVFSPNLSHSHTAHLTLNLLGCLRRIPSKQPYEIHIHDPNPTVNEKYLGKSASKWSMCRLFCSCHYSLNMNHITVYIAFTFYLLGIMSNLIIQISIISN